ncbi:uncharacterized protein LOC106156101 [Lingula anatina]|uniref:Uncharacterized protein LOC106156101 n=1 Tax=Lingula anatina TaxID=7574 RepID=A0A2R2MIT6_LINAN|nr:uncharacterized protein LOC106156101 [Lingula anatina]|eukprot:XP_023930135.1 uncharacterized protein LOC106156101 [Lingula anatina]
MPVKYCCYGCCKSDSRYPERMEGVYFIAFPKPKTQLEKCLTWIRACGRPHRQFSVKNVTKNTYICSKHFKNAIGPTSDYPDPIPFDSSVFRKARKARKRLLQEVESDEDNSHASESTVETETGTGTQTEEQWVSPMDMLATSTDLHILRGE